MGMAPIYSNNLKHIEKSKRVKARMPYRVVKDHYIQDKELKNEVIAGLYAKEEMKCLFDRRKYL